MERDFMGLLPKSSSSTVKQEPDDGDELINSDERLRQYVDEILSKSWHPQQVHLLSYC